METYAHIDWFSVTHKQPFNLPNEMRENPIFLSGKNGYSSVRQFSTGHMEMMNPNRPDMGIHVIYSGKTLENISSKLKISRDKIIEMHLSQGGKATRVDYALNIKNSGINMDNLWDALEDKQSTTKASHTRIQNGQDKGYTIYVGSKKKPKKLIRIYDKAKEMKDFTSDYLRVELQTNQQVARDGLNLYVGADDTYNAINGMIRHFCDFPNLKLWCDIFNHEPVKIPVETHMQGNTEKWLLEKVVPALAKVVFQNSEFMVEFHQELKNRINDLAMAVIVDEYESETEND